MCSTSKWCLSNSHWIRTDLVQRELPWDAFCSRLFSSTGDCKLRRRSSPKLFGVFSYFSLYQKKATWVRLVLYRLLVTINPYQNNLTHWRVMAVRFYFIHGNEWFGMQVLTPLFSLIFMLLHSFMLHLITFHFIDTWTVCICSRRHRITEEN